MTTPPKSNDDATWTSAPDSQPITLQLKNSDDATQASSLAFRKEVLNSWIKRGEEDYKEAERTSDVLEGKAEKVSAMAAVLIAAGLAFINPQVDLTLIAKNLGLIGLVALALGVLSLLVCLGFCLDTMWLRERARPLSADTMETMALDLLALSPSDLASSDLQERYFNDQGRIWKKSVRSIESRNKSKATSLKVAQFTLALALLAAAFVLLEVIYRTYGRVT